MTFREPATAKLREPDTRITSLTINNLSVFMVGEVLEVLKEHFGDVEINLSSAYEAEAKP